MGPGALGVPLEVAEPALALLDVAGLSIRITAVGLAPVRGMASAVVDGDSSAEVAIGTQEGARYGYSGKRGGVPPPLAGVQRRPELPTRGREAGCPRLTNAALAS
jgi:hypothetical protein